MQSGTPAFLKVLLSKTFESAQDVILEMKGEDLNLAYLVTNGFDKPILVNDKEGLEMKVPHEEFGVEDVMDVVGENMEVDVIDSYRHGPALK